TAKQLHLLHRGISVPVPDLINPLGSGARLAAKPFTHAPHINAQYIRLDLFAEQNLEVAITLADPACEVPIAPPKLASTSLNRFTEQARPSSRTPSSSSRGLVPAMPHSTFAPNTSNG